MSTDSVILPASDDSVPPSGTNSLAHDAVDTFEITARLEASGMSDRTVRRRHGAVDVFAYAQSIAQPRESARAPEEAMGWLARPALLESVRRSIILVLGAVLGSLTATILGVGSTQILIVGISAWVIGQAVAGIVWAHAGAGQVKRGVARGTGAAILVTVVLAGSLAVSLVLPGQSPALAALTMAWCWYSCVMSMLVILGRSWFLLTMLASAVTVLIVTLMLGLDAAPTIGVVAALLVIAAMTRVLIAVLRDVDERRRPTLGDWSAAIAPAAQAGFLAAALAVALIQLPEWEGTALIVATVIAAAATDPALVLMRQRLVWSSNRTPLLWHAARHAWLLMLAMSAAIVVVSALVSSLVVLFLVEDSRGATVLVAAIFSSLATTSTTLNAFGLPRGGGVFAAAACISAVAWLTLGTVAGLLCAGAFLVAGIAALLARVSDPRAYA